MISQSIDARGLNCPIPVMKAKKGIKGLQTGQILEILSSDPGSARDFDALCRSTGDKLLSSDNQDDGSYRFVIEKT
ncbi:MAG: sulfurtransferase TusA family protein [Rhodospirillales bacterium]|nr:sulfurtransferase TusA family protein [Rhodospirillales bacterium]